MAQPEVSTEWLRDFPDQSRTGRVDRSWRLPLLNGGFRGSLQVVANCTERSTMSERGETAWPVFVT